MKDTKIKNWFQIAAGCERLVCIKKKEYFLSKCVSEKLFAASFLIIST